MPGAVNTELTAGVPDSPFVRRVEPEEVAAEIVASVASPRFDIFVPRSLGPVSRLSALLSRRGREALGRALKADTAIAGTDWGVRRAYEDRAARAVAAVASSEEEAPPAREQVGA
jgi:hypothetical protein